VPLRNHKLSEGYTYQVYQSTTLKATVAQPQTSDSSKLCLSCHGGTVALGDTVNNGLIPFQNVPPDQKLPPSSRSNLAGAGLNLADDHPVAFVPDLALNNQVHLPPTGDPVKLDQQGRLQCTSCHDPHNEYVDPVENRFLVRNNSAAAICTTCHDLQGGLGANLWSWSGAQGLASSHKTAPNVYDASTNSGVAWLGAHTGYTTTATNACAACHRPHTAHERARLLKGQTDQICFQCHDGNPLTGLRDVKSAFVGKMYVHPSLGPQPSHDPNEAPDPILTRHAACDDRHNPHAARASVATLVPPQLSGSLLGQRGISENGSPHDPRRGGTDALYEFEICFKCHSEQSLHNDESFKQQWRHMQRASCATCHDSHGVPNGTAANNGRLVNFDLNIVAPNSAGQGPVWTDLTPGPGSTTFQGSCSLRCHGKNHSNASY